MSITRRPLDCTYQDPTKGAGEPQIEAVNSSLRRLVKTRGHFPNHDAPIKLLYLGVEKLERRWTRAIPNWPTILGQLTTFFPGQLPNL